MSEDFVKKRNKQRYFMLDVIRVLCALAIFGRHSIKMAGLTYGSVIDGLFLNTTFIVMTCFFVLSGFSIFLSNGKIELSRGDNLFAFYKKRAIGILPIYYMVHIVWLIFYVEDKITGLWQLPSQLFGIQTVFTNVFATEPNGATWFISCLILCYIIYPLVQSIVQRLSMRGRVVLLIALVFISLYMPISSSFSLSYSLYTNPFVRIIEFAIGIVLASICDKYREEPSTAKRNLKATLLVGTSGVALFIIYYQGMPLMQRYVALVLVCSAIYYATQIRCAPLDNSRVLGYISSLAYGFYILQLFVWAPAQILIGALGLGGIRLNFLVPMILLIVMAILVEELYNKPLKKVLNRRKNKGTQ